jgi:hypothetical protein
MKKIITLLATVIFITPTNSQSNLITLETENNADGSITLNANNLASTRYTVKVNFTSLTGFLTTGISNPYINSIGTGKVQVTKLTPDKNAGSHSLGYTYSYYAGMAYRKPPSNFTHYLLPISVGKTTKVSKVEELSIILGQKSEASYYSQAFSYTLGDTICATRAGYVYNINDELKQGEGGNTVFTDNRNKIYIEHKDGTLGYYTILSPINCLVQNGDFVIPGQAIAVFNKESENYRILFSVVYLDEEKIRAEKATDVYNTMSTNFYLNENANSTMLIENQKYESVRSIEIITEELSKREKKKFGFIN